MRHVSIKISCIDYFRVKELEAELEKFRNETAMLEKQLHELNQLSMQGNLPGAHPRPGVSTGRLQGAVGKSTLPNFFYSKSTNPMQLNQSDDFMKTIGANISRGYNPKISIILYYNCCNR